MNLKGKKIKTRSKEIRKLFKKMDKS